MIYYELYFRLEFYQKIYPKIVYPICTHFIFTSRNISLHRLLFSTNRRTILHENGTVRGFSFSKQGFNASEQDNFPYRRQNKRSLLWLLLFWPSCNVEQEEPLRAVRLAMRSARSEQSAEP